MKRQGVMHLIDSLAPGGSERVAVNLVNHLPRNRYHVHLCVTRSSGPLSKLVAPDVGQIILGRKWRFDPGAVMRLATYIRRHDIELLHAHSTSLYTAVVASLLPPHPRVIWHDHFGRFGQEDRPARLYRVAVRRAAGVIAVSEALAEWSCRRLKLPANRVWYVPNFVTDHSSGSEAHDLPGYAGKRIVCVANLRPQKDHLTLLRAMANVVQQMPDAHLLLVGAPSDDQCYENVLEEIARLGVSDSVSLLGQRHDIYDILSACDIGVLSSVSEGMPLSLIEYGMAGLASVATRVGQCAEVLDEGKAGMLVPPGSPDELAEALLILLRSPVARKRYGAEFHKRVQQRYSADAVIKQVCAVYDIVLGIERGQA